MVAGAWLLTILLSSPQVRLGAKLGAKLGAGVGPGNGAGAVEEPRRGVGPQIRAVGASVKIEVIVGLGTRLEN